MAAHIVICAWIVGCSESNNYVTEAQCSQSLCTQEHCFVWSSELQRCGTAEALKKEEIRVRKKAKQSERSDSTKKILPKALRDSLAKIERKEKVIKSEIKSLKIKADSLRVVDSVSGNSLLATVYLKNQLDAEKKALEAKYKTLMDSVEILNLVNHKPITALQWVEYNKRQKKKKLESLEKRKP